MMLYRSLRDPAGLLPPDLSPRWPAEPPLGGIYGEEEVEAAARVIRASSDLRVGFRAAAEVEALEEAFAARVGAPYVVATNGAGAALDLVLRALGVDEGREVVACAASFHGTHLSVLGRGSRLVLCEAADGHLNIDPEDLARRMNERTRAVIVTHLHGLPVDMDRIEGAVAGHRGWGGEPPALIIDAARALGAASEGRPVGSRGTATVFSLQSKKHITALGEGGIVTSHDHSLIEELRDMRSFGRGRGWGSNFKMSKVQAAVALVQLGRLEENLAARERLAQARSAGLAGSGYLVPEIPPGAAHARYLYPLYLPIGSTRERRDRIMARLAREHGVGSVVANPPTYMYTKWIRERAPGRAARTEALTDRLLCPSLHPSMTESENEEITEALIKVLAEVP